MRLRCLFENIWTYLFQVSAFPQLCFIRLRRLAELQMMQNYVPLQDQQSEKKSVFGFINPVPGFIFCVLTVLLSAPTDL